MNEPGWIAFADGAWEIQKQLGVGWADACRRLRVACREEWITTMLAPYENENELPREFWTGPVGQVNGDSGMCPSSNGLGQSELFRDGGSGSFGFEIRRLSTDVSIVAV